MEIYQIVFIVLILLIIWFFWRVREEIKKGYRYSRRERYRSGSASKDIYEEKDI